MAALVEELRAAWLIGENVRGFGNQPMGLQRSLSDLESLGYQAVPFIAPACGVDAPHRRDRVWIVAKKDDTDADSKRPHRAQVNEQRETKPTDRKKRVAKQVRPLLAGPGNASQRRPMSFAHADDAGRRRGSGWDWRSSLHGEDRKIVADAECEGDGRGRLSGSRKDKSQNGQRPSNQFVRCSKVVADAASIDGQRSIGQGGCTRRSEAAFGDGGEDVADADSERPQRIGAKPHPQRRQKSPQRPTGLCDGTARAEWWATEPGVGRVANGVPNRMDRLKALGRKGNLQ